MAVQQTTKMVQTGLRIDLHFMLYIIVSTTMQIPVYRHHTKPVLVITVGPMAVGKTWLATHIYPTFTRVNQDTLKTKSNVQKEFQRAISCRECIVVDNTNPTIETRDWYIQIAKQAGYRIVCYYYDVDKQTAMDLDKQRALRSNTVKIPSIAYHIYYKRLQPPSKDQGFDRVFTITMD